MAFRASFDLANHRERSEVAKTTTIASSLLVPFALRTAAMTDASRSDCQDDVFRTYRLLDGYHTVESFCPNEMPDVEEVLHRPVTHLRKTGSLAIAWFL